jgi:hypothetical protein
MDSGSARLKTGFLTPNLPPIWSGPDDPQWRFHLKAKKPSKSAPASVPPQHRRHGVLHAGDAVGPLQAALSPIGMVKSRDLIG